MEVLFISKSGDALPLAIKANEKHRVNFYMKSYKKPLGQGLLKIAPSWRPHVRSADLVVFDMVGMGYIADLLKRKGKKIVGGGGFNDLIELDRVKGTELMRKAGIQVPPSFSFRTINEGKKYIKAHPKRYVLKPLGNQDTMWTYVAQMEDSRDLVDMMDLAPMPEGFELQEFVEGVEISTEGWFDGTKFVPPFNHTLEEKRFMDRDKGPSTGCMGNIVWFTERDRLVEETLLKVEPYLRKMGYIGPLDINCIVNKKDAYGLEWTARFGYSALWAFLEAFKEDFVTWLNVFAEGNASQIPVDMDKWAIAIRLSVPPYPTDKDNIKNMVCSGWPFYFEDEAWKHIWLADAYRDKQGVYRVAGVDGVVMEVSALGSSLREARRRVYRTVNKIIIPNKQYRSDIGMRALTDVPALQRWGWIELPAGLSIGQEEEDANNQ